ncbi:MAG: 23S rRNA (uracil(1939)-C(5))-methyltransferase RlmD [Flavobacteriales bacterium]|nr:23S rRNA (uracil(1939)-C(5))-methyltransferase RlmD [Flavobacteriales bacterium]
MVKYGSPGDVADIRLYAKKKKTLYAEIDRLITPGPDRTEPFCEHFGVCGGCKWQHMSYKAQLHWKNQQVKDAFQRIGKIDCEEWLPILPAPAITEYRNKLEFAFSNKRWLLDGETEADNIVAAGFHISGRYDKILDINNCHLQENLCNELRKFIKKYAIENNISFYDIKAGKGFLRNVTFRNTRNGSWMMILIAGESDDKKMNGILESMSLKFPELTSIIYGVNDKVNDAIYDLELHTFKGNDFLTEMLGDLKYKIRPKSFFQTNPDQALHLYNIVLEFADLKGNELVYDLYCGTGSISLFVARSAQKVYGIESVPQAIEDARDNAILNGIKNVEFTVGDMRYELNDVFVKNTGTPDLVITDPPRAGMHPAVVAQLLKMSTPKIVYVSCNPATQARDLEMLAEKYNIRKTKPVDMFPHTHHVENVTLLELK